MELERLAQLPAAPGAPLEKPAETAAQPDKRARDLAAEKGRACDEAMARPLKLMREGRAAGERGLQGRRAHRSASAGFRFHGFPS